MPDDGGVDVVTGACPPPKDPPKKDKKSPNSISGCGEKKDITLKAGTCSYFIVTVKHKRMPAPARKELGKRLKEIVAENFRSVPTHH